MPFSHRFFMMTKLKRVIYYILFFFLRLCHQTQRHWLRSLILKLHVYINYKQLISLLINEYLPFNTL